MIANRLPGNGSFFIDLVMKNNIVFSQDIVILVLKLVLDIVSRNVMGGTGMKEQDLRAVEAMCSCGMDFDTLCACFPGFLAADLKNVYDNYKGVSQPVPSVAMSVNCS